jgi:hypothetical protein
MPFDDRETTGLAGVVPRTSAQFRTATVHSILPFGSRSHNHADNPLTPTVQYSSEHTKQVDHSSLDFTITDG